MNNLHFEVLLPTLLLLSSSTSFCVSVMAIKLIVNEHYAWLSIFLMGKCCVCLKGNNLHFEVLLPTLLLLSSSNSFCVSVMAIKLIVNEHYAWLSIFLMGKCCVCLNEQSTF
ncbi:hypothetical protein CDAR_186561 [Caerostris darwini]|uniref:NADH dehydrogenase subunit 4L n=1 Tax=Caerostris darwini TaxID=1538125 RepID=A0AAV4VUN6_9ARAC|nr:hypothetical protein CDAR_186561 [Caerostris darwini]